MIFSGLVAAVSTMVIAAPNALADNNVCVGVMNQSESNPAPWNGQLMETWNTPGYYGAGPTGRSPATRSPGSAGGGLNPDLTLVPAP